MKILNKKAFSIIQSIFVILILSILASAIVPNIMNLYQDTSIKQCYSDSLLIQEALKSYKNKLILENKTNNLYNLDDGIYLFSNILKKNNFFNNYWTKVNNNTYAFHFNNGDTLNFIYSFKKLTFTCNNNNDLCKKVLN